MSMEIDVTLTAGTEIVWTSPTTEAERSEVMTVIEDRDNRVLVESSLTPRQLWQVVTPRTVVAKSEVRTR